MSEDTKNKNIDSLKEATFKKAQGNWQKVARKAAIVGIAVKAMVEKFGISGKGTKGISAPVTRVADRGKDSSKIR